MTAVQRSTRLNAANLAILFVWTLGLIGVGPRVADALEIRVTPSVLDVVSTTAEVDGRSLIGGSAGDQFTLGYTVENPGAADIQALFTSIVFDPSALRFVGGVSFPILETFVPVLTFDALVSLAPLIDPRARPTSPDDTLFGLNHIVRPVGDKLFPTNAIGPDLAIAVTFEILDSDLWTSIDMAFLAGDAAIINGVSYLGVGSSTQDSRDASSDSIIKFENFKVGPGHAANGSTPVPEPGAALLIGLGLIGLSGFSPHRRALR